MLILTPFIDIFFIVENQHISFKIGLLTIGSYKHTYY